MKYLIKSLNHVALVVKDLEISIDFYSNKLNFNQIKRPNFDFAGAWFSLGDNKELHLILGLDDINNSAPRQNHFAIEVTDIIAVEKYLKDQNIIIRGPKSRPDGAIQIFISDPDGHFIEFTCLSLVKNTYE